MWTQQRLALSNLTWKGVLPESLQALKRGQVGLCFQAQPLISAKAATVHLAAILCEYQLRHSCMPVACCPMTFN